MKTRFNPGDYASTQHQGVRRIVRIEAIIPDSQPSATSDDLLVRVLCDGKTMLRRLSQLRKIERELIEG